MNQLAVIVALFVIAYVVLRPIIQEQQRLGERLDGLREQIDAVRRLRDTEFALAMRDIAPSPLRRHVRLSFQPTDQLMKVLTKEELELLRDQKISFPELSIECWKSHTVVECRFAEQGHPRTTRVLAFDTDTSKHLTIWQVALGQHPDWPMLSPRLELQYHTREESLTLGPLLGRFDSEDRFDHLLPRSEFRFVALGLSASELVAHRRPPEPDDASADDRIEYLYECESPPDVPVRWNAIVREVEKFDRWCLEATLPARGSAD